MPIPQRHVRARPPFFGTSLPSSGSVSPASTSSSLSKTGAQSMSTRPTVKPGQSVPRKTTLHFIASTVAVERQEVESQDSEVVHPDADEVEVSEVKLIQRKPMGLGELIAAHQGRGRPPRGPIAHRMGFDIVTNPSHGVLIMPGDTIESGSSTSPSSLPGLSRSDGTTSTLSPDTDFPVLPLIKSGRGDQPSRGVDDADEASDDDEADDWDMVHPDNDAWVGIETGHPAGSTGDNTDDELIFLDEESLMAMKKADENKKLVAADGKDKDKKERPMDYAGIVKA